MMIGDAEIEDANAVFVMARELATSFNVENDAFRYSFEKVISSGHQPLLVAESDDGELVGYLLGSYHDAFYANGQVAWVEELFVVPEHRGNGTGRSLIEVFEARAKSHGCKLVAMATRRAEGFYSQLGYEASATYFKKHL